MGGRLCDGLDVLLEVSDEARELGVFVSYTVAWSGGGRPLLDPLADAIDEFLRTVNSRHTLETLKEDPIVRAYRNFYWRLGIDPTKTRPASEALVRRALRGSFPRLGVVVDAGNIASAETLVPIGLYDLQHSSPPFTMTLSKGGEIFRPIGGGAEVLKVGVPILVDSRGTVMHLYPHRDCVETMIRESTREVLIVGAGVPGVLEDLVARATERTAELLAKAGWCWCAKSVMKPKP
ncbi:MAG: phenylalanine--tRNA ligase beta subunit-related protein [Zestosphaera sp.]